jgi:Putative lumazine-binding
MFTLLAPGLSFGQSGNSVEPTDKIMGVIDELFDGYRAGDSSRVKAVFTNDAKIQSVYTTNEGKESLTELKPISEFINYIGGGLAEVHDERLWEVQIHADNKLATVWARYVFFLGNNFSHCGTETFLLHKVNNEWKIFYLVDTRQKTGCELPANIK